MQPRSASACSAVFNCAAGSPAPLRFHSGIGGAPCPIYSRMASSAAYSPAVGSSFSAAVIAAPLVVGAPTLSRTYDTSEAPQPSSSTRPAAQVECDQRSRSVGPSRPSGGLSRGSDMCRQVAHCQDSCS